MRRLLVIVLERACGAVDHLWDWPPPFRWIARWLGCPSGLARWSAELDERWGLGVWSAMDREYRQREEEQ